MSQNNQSNLTEVNIVDNLPGNISELYVFGDLLSDTGNLFETTEEAFGQGFPQDPFFEGRYANGELWVENLAFELGIPYNFDTNFASIGSTTGLNNVGNPFETNDVVEQLGLPGTLGQVNNFIASTPNLDSNGLHIVWAGAYDLGLGVTDPTEPVNNIITSVENLADAGAKNILVPNLPDFNRFPGAQDLPNAENQREIIEDWNANLLQELDERLDPDVNLIQLDTNSLFDEILSDSAQFGFTNASDRFISTSRDDSGIVYEVINPEADPDDYVFFGNTAPSDPEPPAQPSAATHEIIGEFALSVLASTGIETTEQLGTAGDDTIIGFNDSNNIRGLAGNDRIEGRDDADIILGGVGDDTIQGDAGNDYLLGGSENDVLVGGKGDDILNGGANHNSLQGNEGQDLFVLNFNGFSIIEDFDRGQDKLDLAGSLVFDDLNIVQQGSDTGIYLDDTELARLSNFDADLLNIADFEQMI